MPQAHIEDQDATVGDQQRVAVGSGMPHQLCGDGASRPRTVLDHDRLPELLRQRRQECTRHCIGTTTGRITNHDADGLGWIGLGVRRQHTCKDAGSECDGGGTAVDHA